MKEFKKIKILADKHKGIFVRIKTENLKKNLVDDLNKCPLCEMGIPKTKKIIKEI